MKITETAPPRLQEEVQSMMSQFVNCSDCREGCAVVDRRALSSPMTVMCSNVESLTVAVPPVMEMSETFS